MSALLRSGGGGTGGLGDNRDDQLHAERPEHLLRKAQRQPGGSREGLRDVLLAVADAVREIGLPYVLLAQRDQDDLSKPGAGGGHVSPLPFRGANQRAIR